MAPSLPNGSRFRLECNPFFRCFQFGLGFRFCSASNETIQWFLEYEKKDQQHDYVFCYIISSGSYEWKKQGFWWDRCLATVIWIWVKASFKFLSPFSIIFSPPIWSNLYWWAHVENTWLNPPFLPYFQPN